MPTATAASERRRSRPLVGVRAAVGVKGALALCDLGRELPPGQELGPCHPKGVGRLRRIQRLLRPEHKGRQPGWPDLLQLDWAKRPGKNDRC